MNTTEKTTSCDKTSCNWKSYCHSKKFRIGASIRIVIVFAIIAGAYKFGIHYGMMNRDAIAEKYITMHPEKAAEIQAMMWNSTALLTQQAQDKLKDNWSVQETNKKIVQQFYDNFGKVDANTLNTYMDENRTSTSSQITATGTLWFADQSAGFLKAIPDMKLTIQEVIGQGNKVIVRSIISGTPSSGNFMGVNTDGNKSFSIIAIDIHTIQNNKIVSSYHLEDWAGALQQLSK